MHALRVFGGGGETEARYGAGGLCIFGFFLEGVVACLDMGAIRMGEGGG